MFLASPFKSLLAGKRRPPLPPDSGDDGHGASRLDMADARTVFAPMEPAVSELVGLPLLGRRTLARQQRLLGSDPGLQRGVCIGMCISVREGRRGSMGGGG